MAIGREAMHEDNRFALALVGVIEPRAVAVEVMPGHADEEHKAQVEQRGQDGERGEYRDLNAGLVHERNLPRVVIA